MEKRVLVEMTHDQFETLRDMICAREKPKLREYETAAIRSLLDQFKESAGA